MSILIQPTLRPATSLPRQTRPHKAPDSPPAVTDRIHISAPPRGAIPARQVALAFNPPAPRASQDFGMRVQGSSQPSQPPSYGEDFAAIVLKGRTEEDFKQYLQDPFITNLAEMTILDRYKPGVEEALKKWIPFLQRSDFNRASGRTLDMNFALDLGSTAAAAQAPHSLRYFKPTIGLRLAEFSQTGAMVKPGLDLLTYHSDHDTEVVLSTGLAVNLKGQLYPDGELVVKQGLVNPPDRPATYFESKTYYDSFNQDIQFRIGLRQEVSRDQAFGLYSRYVQPFQSAQRDFGVGLYYHQKFW